MKPSTQKYISFLIAFLILVTVSIGGVSYALSFSQDDGFCDEAAGVIVCCSVDDGGDIGSCKIVGPVVEDER